MIKRDKYGIIVQHDPYNKAYLDGGDSSNRTGIMALCGYEEDSVLLRDFVDIDGMGCRHPYQPPYDNPGSWTRDQLLPFAAGCWSAALRMTATELLISHAKRGFICQNKLNIDGSQKKWWQRDILAPSHIGHLILCAKAWLLYPFLVVAVPWLLLDIFWAAKVTPDHESNQILSMCSVYGAWTLKLYCWLHPDWKKCVNDYWSGWRDQMEIGLTLINYIEGRLR